MTQLAETPAIRPLRQHLARGLAEALQELKDADPNRDPAPVMADALLMDAMRTQATDIHFEPQGQGLLVRLRIDGQLYDTVLLPGAQGQKIIRHFKAGAGLDTSQHSLPTNTRITRLLDGHMLDLRLSGIPCAGGEALTIRILVRDRAERRLENLGFTIRQRRNVVRWIEHAFGMLLVAGPSGSGKTTTLYGLMQELRSRECAIFTIEDPIEYQVDGVIQSQVDMRHDLTFSRGLRCMLRLDPDYLLMGEIREPDDARAAVEASSCGRMLLSTIHAADAVGVVRTLRNMGISDSEIAGSLRVAVAQRLVRRLCPHCRTAASAKPGANSDAVARRSTPGFEAVGCEQCQHVGYAGRVGLYELWRPSDEDRELIQSHGSEYALRRRLNSANFRTMRQDAMKKVRDGVTSMAEVRRALASYPVYKPAPTAQRAVPTLELSLRHPVQSSDKIAERG